MKKGKRGERWKSRERGQRGEGNRGERRKEGEIKMEMTQKGNLKVAFWNVEGVKGKE